MIFWVKSSEFFCFDKLVGFFGTDTVITVCFFVHHMPAFGDITILCPEGHNKQDTGKEQAGTFSY